MRSAVAFTEWLVTYHIRHRDYGLSAVVAISCHLSAVIIKSTIKAGYTCIWENIIYLMLLIKYDRCWEVWVFSVLVTFPQYIYMLGKSGFISVTLVFVSTWFQLCLLFICLMFEYLYCRHTFCYSLFLVTRWTSIATKWSNSDRHHLCCYTTRPVFFFLAVWFRTSSEFKCVKCTAQVRKEVTSFCLFQCDVFIWTLNMTLWLLQTAWSFHDW